jgi:hypothetical protein
MVGPAFTVTVDIEEAMQPFASVAVTVYIVVEDGEAVTVAPVAELKLAEGDQE